MKDEDQPKKHIQTEETHPTQIQTEKKVRTDSNCKQKKEISQTNHENPKSLSVTIRDAPYP